MTTVTPLQAKMLKRIAEHECTPLNGARPTRREDANTWLTGVVRTKEDKGVMVSLINAGLIGTWACKEEPMDSTIYLTQAGFEVYQAL